MKPIAIIGQGIAGSMLAWQCIIQNIPFHIIDKGHNESASYAAGALINPIMGRNFQVAWQHEVFYSFALSTYKAIEERLDVKFCFEKNIQRILSNEEEHLNLIRNIKKKQIEHFFESSFILAETPNYLTKGYSLASVHYSGVVYPKILLNAIRTFLSENDWLSEQSFNNSDFNSNLYSAIVDCRGYYSSISPEFGYLPFSTVKGEEIEIKSENIPPQTIVAKGRYLVADHHNKNIFRFGSTYDWEDKQFNPTQKSKDELINAFEDIFSVPYTINSQQAGIRPATKNRKPFCGKHPKLPNWYILNGLGTRGFTLAPLLAKQLLDNILTNKALDNDCDISVYDSKYQT